MQLMVFRKRLLSIKNQRRSIMVLIKISPVILMVLIGFSAENRDDYHRGDGGIKDTGNQPDAAGFAVSYACNHRIHISYYCRHRNNASGAFRCFYHRNAHKKSCPVGRNIFPLFSHQL